MQSCYLFNQNIRFMYFCVTDELLLTSNFPLKVGSFEQTAFIPEKISDVNMYSVNFQPQICCFFFRLQM